HDESYHEVFRKLRMFNTRPWFIIDSLVKTVIPDFAMPADSPAWKTAAPHPGEGDVWKAIILADGSKEPEGWAGLDFDDSNWQGKGEIIPKKGKNIPEEEYRVRIPFELTSTSLKQVRVRFDKFRVLTPGGTVYLNGACVVDSYSGMSGGRHGNAIRLLDNSKHLLRKGRNVFAYSSRGKKLPCLALDVEPKLISIFPWTNVPGRNRGLRELTAQRRTPGAYYTPAQDQRKPDELVAAMSAEPFFMPEVYYALERFHDIVTNFDDRTPYANKLLESAYWGKRLSGLLILRVAMMPLDHKETKGLPKTELSALRAGNGATVAAGRVGAARFLPQVIKMGEGPHPKGGYQ
ncbi:hypothetical protein BVX99_00655, partial [bacterium F16]